MEFALTLPLLLLVLTGVLWFGVVLYQGASLSQATQVGVRQLAVSRGQTSDPCATLYNGVTGAASNLKQTNLTLTLTLNGTTYTGTTCPSAAADMVLGGAVQVKATYPTKLVLYGDIISPGFNLNSQEQDKIQ